MNSQKTIENLMDKLVTTDPPISDILKQNHLESPVSSTGISDEIRCFTDYLPRAFPTENTLSGLIVKGLASNATSLVGIGKGGDYYGGWYKNVFEVVNSGKPQVIDKALEKGYQDFKYAIYGSPQSGIYIVYIYIYTVAIILSL